MSNLANIFVHYKRKYGENLVVTLTPPASYLVSIAGEKEAPLSTKVIFLREENRSPADFDEHALPSKLILQATRVNADPNLTGSPLKDECESLVDIIGDMTIDDNLRLTNPWKLEEEYHKGISDQRALTIINAESLQAGLGDNINGISNVNGSVWVLCNAANVERTLLLQYEYLAGRFSRGIVRFLGVVSICAVNTQHLLKRHYELMEKPMQLLDTFIENIYHIRPHIILCCSWSTKAQVPSLIDLSTCNVVLKQVFCVSDCGPLTQDLMNQLRMLMFLRDDIVAYKESEKNECAREPVYRCGRGIDIDELCESINKVMTEISGFAEIDTDDGLDCDIEGILQRSKLRQLTDLTDKLWDILKRCASYKDLKMAFNILFQSAARCNLVNMPTNRNRLAEIITEVANRRLAIPCLSGSEPLELLLEIGLEKLYKDYEFIFTETKICSANSLKHDKNLVAQLKDGEKVVQNVRKSLHNAARCDNGAIMRKTLLYGHGDSEEENKYEIEDVLLFKNSHFDRQETMARIAKLLRLHCTLEHLLMLHINLNLNSVAVYAYVCEQLLRRPTNGTTCMGSTIEDSLTDKMEIALSVREVKEHLEGKVPHSRRITMLSGNRFREVKSTFFCSMDNVCPPGVSEHFRAEDEESVKDNIYYLWHYRKISSTH